MVMLPAPQNAGGLPTPQSTGLPMPYALDDPMFGVNPYTPGENMYTGFTNPFTLPSMMERRQQQQLAIQMASLRSMGLAPDTDPHEWTPEMAAQQTDQALAKIATVNPEVAEQLAAQRAPGEDTGEGFWDGLLDAAGFVLAPALNIGGKVLDVISRTASIVPNIVMDASDGGDFDIWGDIGGALSGNQRTNWNQVFQEWGWEGDGIGGFLRATVGFVGDVATDPLSWLTFGAGGVTSAGAQAAAKTGAIRSVASLDEVGKVFNATGDELIDVLSTKYDDFIKGAQARGFKMGDDLDERFWGLMGETYQGEARRVMGDIFELSDKAYRNLRTRSFATFAKQGEYVTSSGLTVTGKQLRGGIEEAIRAGAFKSRLSPEWAAARHMSSALGGARLRGAIPFTSLRYISPAVPGSKFISEKTIGAVSRMFAGQSGMNRMAAAVARGDGTWQDMQVWMEQGFDAALQQNRHLVDGIRGRFKGLGSMTYAASEQMGRITSHFDSAARAGRAGLMGYYSSAARKEAENTMKMVVRESAYSTPSKAGTRRDRQRFLRDAEAVLGVSYRRKYQKASPEEMWDFARYSDWFPAGVDTGSAEAIESWFWSIPKHQAARVEGGEAMQKAEGLLAEMQDVAARIRPDQRELLDHMAIMQKTVRSEAAKRDVLTHDVGMDYESVGILHPNQADEWAQGAHPLINSQTFYLDVQDAGEAQRLRSHGINDTDVLDHDEVSGIRATRAKGGNGGTSHTGTAVPVRIRGGNWIVVNRADETGLTSHGVITDARAQADEAARVSAEARDEVLGEPSGSLLSSIRNERSAVQMTTEQLRKQRPEADGVIYVNDEGIDLVAFEPGNVKVVSEQAGELVEGRGFRHRMFTDEAREWLRGKMPENADILLVAEPTLRATLRRATIGQDLSEAEDTVRKMLADRYGAEGMPERIWELDPLKVFDDYVGETGEAVASEMLGQASRRIVAMGDMVPAMFGAGSPRAQKFEWMLAPGLLRTLRRKDQKLTRTVLQAVQRGERLMEEQHQRLADEAEQYGMLAATVEEALASGVEVPSRFVQAVRRYGSSVGEAQTAIGKERMGLDEAEGALDQQLIAWDAIDNEVKADPTLGHPRGDDPIAIEQLADGRQRVKGWHASLDYGDPLGMVQGVDPLDLGSGGFHIGTHSQAVERLRQLASLDGRTVGSRDGHDWGFEVVDDETGESLAVGRVFDNGAVELPEEAIARVRQQNAGAAPLRVEKYPPDIFIEDHIHAIEAEGRFAGAGPEGTADAGLIMEGREELGLSFTASPPSRRQGEADDWTPQKKADRDKWLNAGYDGVLYQNAVEGSGESLVILNPADNTFYARAPRRLEDAAKEGKLFIGPDGKLVERRVAGSKKVRPREDILNELARIRSRQQELADLDRSLRFGADDVLREDGPLLGPLEVSGRVPKEGALVYRGTPKTARSGVRDGTRVWYKSLFVSHDRATAKAYAGADGRVEQLRLKPGARVLVEGTPEFDRIFKPRTGVTGQAEELDQLVRDAKKAGYDAIQMNDQDGLGTAILNPNSVERNWRRAPVSAAARRAGEAGASVAQTSAAMARRQAQKQVSAGKRLKRLSLATHHAMTEANRAYAEAKGALAKVQPALVKVETAGQMRGLTRLHVAGLEGYAMPAYIAEEFHRIIDKQGVGSLRTAWRHYVMGPWKRWATYRWPGFHVRNFFGAFFNNWLGGVNEADYVFSWRVNHARDGHLKWAGKEVSAAERKMFQLDRVFGKDNPVTYDDVAQLMGQQGIGRANTMSVMGIGDARDAVHETYEGAGRPTKNLARRGARKFDGLMRSMGSSVEDFHRVAAWSRGMASTGGDTYGARAFVMMRHGDYADLTDAEDFIRDLVPFYKWMRTNTPYQLRMLAESPGQLTKVADKAEQLVYDVQGIDRREAELQQPKWMKESFAVPIPSWVPVVGSKSKDALQFAMFDLPYADLYNGLGAYLSSGLPVVRNVLESYGVNQQVFSGVPLTGEYKPLSGVFNIPGIRDILHTVGLTRRGADGREYMEDKLQNVMMAWPIFSRFRNFTESDPDRIDARAGGLFSMIAGVGIRAGDFTQAELDFYYNEVRPLLDEYKSLGIKLPTVDDLQSAQVGAAVGLFADDEATGGVQPYQVA